MRGMCEAAATALCIERAADQQSAFAGERLHRPSSAVLRAWSNTPHRIASCPALHSIRTAPQNALRQRQRALAVRWERTSGLLVDSATTNAVLLRNRQCSRVLLSRRAARGAKKFLRIVVGRFERERTALCTVHCRRAHTRVADPTQPCHRATPQCRRQAPQHTLCHSHRCIELGRQQLKSIDETVYRRQRSKVDAVCTMSRHRAGVGAIPNASPCMRRAPDHRSQWCSACSVLPLGPDENRRSIIENAPRFDVASLQEEGGVRQEIHQLEDVEKLGGTLERRGGGG